MNSLEIPILPETEFNFSGTLLVLPGCIKSTSASKQAFTDCSTINISHFEFILQYVDYPQFLPFFSDNASEYADFFFDKYNQTKVIKPIKKSPELVDVQLVSSNGNLAFAKSVGLDFSSLVTELRLEGFKMEDSLSVSFEIDFAEWVEQGK